MKQLLLFTFCFFCFTTYSSGQVTIGSDSIAITNSDFDDFIFNYRSSKDDHQFRVNHRGHALWQNSILKEMEPDEYWQIAARQTGNFDIAFGTLDVSRIKKDDAIVTFTQSGRVGILTDEPDSPLDVDGPVTIRRTSGQIATGVKLKDENDDLVGRMTLSSGGGMAFDAFQGGDISFGGVGISNTMHFTNNGDLGLGIAASAVTAKAKIGHNSTLENAHLELFETNSNGFARLKFRSNYNLGNLLQNQKRTFVIQANPANTNDPKLHIAFDDDDTDNAIENIFTVQGEDMQVGINKTAPEGYLHIKQKISGIEGIVLENEDNNGSDKWSLEVGENDLILSYNGVTVGIFDDANGNYNTFSDRRLKNSIASLSNGVIEKVMMLNPVTYYFNHDKVKDKRTYGFIAQEVQKVNEDWVVAREDDFLGISYVEFVPILTKAIQEQQEVINEKDEQIHALQQELENVQDVLNRVIDFVGLPEEPVEEKITLTDAQLGQNQPNPTAGQTTIPFLIPEHIKNAVLRISGINGEVIYESEIGQRGPGLWKVDTKSLSPATYQYSLVLDGQLVATRRMVIQK